MDKTITWDRDIIQSGAVAYELSSRGLLLFGISDDGIPYTKRDANGDSIIDPEALKKAGEKPMFA
jgi:hypothetical protein